MFALLQVQTWLQEIVLSHLRCCSGVQILHVGYGPSILAVDEGWQVGVKGLDEGFVKLCLVWGWVHLWEVGGLILLCAGL